MSSIDQKKKPSRHGEHHRDGASGMSSATKKHFDHVRRKMRAFVDQHHRRELDGGHFAPQPKAFHHAHPPPPPPQAPMFLDHKQIPKQSTHHRTPVQARKQFLTPAPARKQVPQHLILGTPQMARRVGK